MVCDCSPFKALEAKVIGGVTLNHLSWAALGGGMCACNKKIYSRWTLFRRFNEIYEIERLYIVDHDLILYRMYIVHLVVFNGC